MLFILGIIVGLLIALIAITTMTYFRSKIEEVLHTQETQISNAGPRPKGGIYLPEDEGTVARNEIIKKNKEEGRDTPISELE